MKNDKPLIYTIANIIFLSFIPIGFLAIVITKSISIGAIIMFITTFISIGIMMYYDVFKKEKEIKKVVNEK